MYKFKYKTKDSTTQVFHIGKLHKLRVLDEEQIIQANNSCSNAKSKEFKIGSKWSITLFCTTPKCFSRILGIFPL